MLISVLFKISTVQNDLSTYNFFKQLSCDITLILDDFLGYKRCTVFGSLEINLQEKRLI